MNASTAFRLAAAVLATTLLVPVAANAQAAAGTAPDLERGRTIASTVCMACHTIDGSRGAAVNPILAGQHPEYLAKQLREFKAGKRANAIMAGFAAMLSDADMVNVAAFYGSLPPVKGESTKPDLVLLGERIWRGGIAAKNVPACAGCHSPNGAGIPAQYPRLGGQHAEYVESSLRAYRSGERANNAQMSAIAANLSDREIAALANYAAGLR